MNQKSPKQTLLNMLPEVNKTFAEHGFTCIAFWNAPNINFKNGCYLRLERDSEQIRLQTIISEATKEQTEFINRFKICVIEVEKILSIHFNVFPYYGSNFFRKLELKNVPQNKLRPKFYK